MTSTQRPANSNNGQNSPDGKSAHDVQSGLDGTIALVYPDGRVTNVKVTQK